MLKNILLFLSLFLEFKYCSQQVSAKDCIPDMTSNGFKYDGIALDFYGTLDDVYSTTTLRANSLNLSTDFVFIWRLKQLSYSWLRTGMGRYRDLWKLTWDAMEWTLAFYKVKLTKKTEQIPHEFMVKIHGYADVKEKLKVLQNMTSNHYVFSDDPLSMLETGLKNAGVTHFFYRKVLSSDEVKMFIPNPMAYAYLQKTLCTKKEKLLFISGNNWQIRGAKSYGFKTTWISRFGTPEDILGFPADSIQIATDQAERQGDGTTGNPSSSPVVEMKEQSAH